LGPGLRYFLSDEACGLIDRLVSETVQLRSVKGISVVGSQVSYEKFAQTFRPYCPIFTRVKKCEIWPRFATQSTSQSCGFKTEQNSKKIRNMYRERR